LAARLPGTSRLDLELVGRAALSPSIVELTLAADALSDFCYTAGQDLMVDVPADTGTFRRRYTIRRLDPRRHRLDLDVVLHGDGPGARWAAGADLGTRVRAIGPRGKITLDPSARWHLFVVDESGLPGALAMAEARAPGTRATAVVEVDPGEGVAGAGADGLELRWVERGEAPGSSVALLEALGRFELPGGPGHAYLAGELGVVAAVRRALLDRGLGAEKISSKPYWRLGVANAAHGEPARR
jgi:NADPH-dependent ferric siderophore reductase